MAWLGTWQLARAKERSAESVAERQSVAPRPLTEVLGPQQSFTGEMVDLPVIATGTWDGARQLLVANRRLDGVEGLWVLTPLVMADGSAVGVVRGWVASADDPAARAPLPSAVQGSSAVQVRGVLTPGEAPVDRLPGQASGLPDGQIAAVAVPELVKQWPYPLLTGYVLATQVEPAVQPAPALVPTVDEVATGWQLRNVSYAVQWWIFAGFGLFLWYRLVRDDHRGTLTSPSLSPSPSPEPDRDRSIK